MLTKADRRQRNKALENIRRTRIQNLRKMAEFYESWAEFARRVGYAATFLTSIAGPNPRRNIGEQLAREIERRLQLDVGYLDVTH